MLANLADDQILRWADYISDNLDDQAKPMPLSIRRVRPLSLGAAAVFAARFLRTGVSWFPKTRGFALVGRALLLRSSGTDFENVLGVSEPSQKQSWLSHSLVEVA